MTELGDTEDADALIPGNPTTIGSTQEALKAYGDMLHLAGQGLRRIDTSEGWRGEAADAFREVYHGQPGKWLRAGDAFHDAANALGSYISTLTWAQSQAGDAIILSNAGKAHHQAAQDTLDSARSQLDSAGHTAAVAVGRARDLAPPKPSLWSRMAHDAGDFLSGAGHVAKDVGETVATDLASIGNAAINNPGSLAETAGGIGLMALGAGGEVGGTMLDATGIGALVGVPANVASAGAIASGAGLAGAGMSNILRASGQQRGQRGP
ncbi:putative T7SS-secreted protein [Streptomyces sp. NBC_01497]|uniref:putative T7SS-secreted protein n=1 Tax=Streptomyces sp. NBC_01497 TaxID=2903885 RepID=UPI002E30928B|nr:hypothetical protein [Streptomyces sp. NBC_01497]